MKSMRLAFGLLATTSMIALLTSGAIAQPPGGGFTPPPGFMEKIKAWQKYGKEHAKLSELRDSIYKIEKVNEEDGLKLDKKQASTMLGIINSYKSKPSMTEDEASGANKKVTGLLNLKQIKKMVTIPSPFGGGGRPGGGGGGFGGGGKMGGGAPGGKMGGGPPGGKMGGMPAFPDPPKVGYNPFNPDSLPGMMKERTKKSLDDFKAALTSQAK